MTCDRCRDNYTEFLEGSLAAVQQKAMEAHLASCPTCAAELEEFRAAVSALRALPPVPPPPRLLGSIAAALDEAAPAPRPQARWSWQVAGTVAMAACLLMGFTVVLRHGLILPKTAQESRSMAPAAPPTLAQMPKSEYGAAEAPPAGPQLKTGETAAPLPAPGGAPAADSAAPSQPAGPAMAGASESGHEAGAKPRASAASGRAKTTTQRPSPRGGVKPGTGRGARGGPRRPTPPAEGKESFGKGLAAGLEIASADRPPAPAPELPAMDATTADTAERARTAGAVPEAVEPPTFGMPGGFAAAKSMPDSAPGTGGAMAPRAPGGPRAAPSADAGVELGGQTVQMSFVPPAQRTVGVPCVGSVVVQLGEPIDAATLRVRGDEGLKVTNTSSGDVLFKGPLPPTRTTFAVGLLAEEAGTRALDFRLQGPNALDNATLKAHIAGFEPRGQLGPDAQGEKAEAPSVTFVFRQRDIAEALRAVAQRGKVRLELGPGVGGEKVNVELRDVPVEAALRILCEAAGCSLHGGGREFRVTRP